MNEVPKLLRAKEKKKEMEQNLTWRFVFSLETKNFHRVNSSSVTFYKGFLLKEKYLANTFLL